MNKLLVRTRWSRATVTKYTHKQKMCSSLLLVNRRELMTVNKSLEKFRTQLESLKTVGKMSSEKSNLMARLHAQVGKLESDRFKIEDTFQKLQKDLGKIEGKISLLKKEESRSRNAIQEIISSIEEDNDSENLLHYQANQIPFAGESIKQTCHKISSSHEDKLLRTSVVSEMSHVLEAKLPDGQGEVILEKQGSEFTASIYVAGNSRLLSRIVDLDERLRRKRLFTHLKIEQRGDV